MKINMAEKYTFKFYIAVCMVCLSFFQSCNSEKESKVNLDPDPLNQILDNYVNDGTWPFLYSKIEDGITGRAVYEHLAINREFFPNLFIDGNTWMRIWSMSKLITITIAMDLVEDGLITLKDPVSNYIPEFTDLMVAIDKDGESIASSRLTNFDCPHDIIESDSIMIINHLLNHRAGFYYALTPSKCLNFQIASKKILNSKNGEELIEILSSLPLIQQPGESYFYGLNTTVLGLVLERATGKSLNDLFKERIGDAYGIKGLSYVKPNDIKLIPGYTGRDGVLREVRDGELDIFGGDVPRYYPEDKLFLGGEGMLGTANGYIEFMRYLFFKNQDSFLNKNTIKMMFSEPNVEKNDYGYNTGFGMYLTSKTHEYEKDILRVGGYEKTGSWVDRKNNLIGVLFSQANETRDKEGLANRMEQDFKKELYRQLNK